MIEPEPDHLFLKLRGRINSAQQIAANRFIGELIAAVIERLARRLLVGAVGHEVDLLILSIDISKPLDGIRMGNFECRDLCGYRSGQYSLAGMQLPIQKPLAAR